MKVEGTAQEGRVVVEVKAGPGLGHFAESQELLVYLDGHAWQEHLGVPQAAHHEEQVVVKLLARLPADVKRLLQSGDDKKEERKKRAMDI